MCEPNDPLGVDVAIACSDGYKVIARHMRLPGRRDNCSGAVIIAPATGVPARYYWRFARYLASEGFVVVIPDYRGIGRSAPAGGGAQLRKLKTRWHEWGTLDLDAVIAWIRGQHGPEMRISVVGHSFGGIAAILAPRSRELDRLLIVGAQHAHWRDYAEPQRRLLFWKWHVVMPAITFVLGYFPGRRLGWLEDLPRGVALDWARSRANFARTIGKMGSATIQNAATLTFPILAVNPTDDPYATPVAARRTLSYVPNARVDEWRVAPAELGATEIGHFGLFHDRFSKTFWPHTARWLAGASL